MIRFKGLNILCIILLQSKLVFCQWYAGSSPSDPIYYVPASAPPEYVNYVQGRPGSSIKYEQNPPLGNPTSVYVPPQVCVPPPIGVPPQVAFLPPPIYEGQYQAAAAAAAHPNQPVIIINNGDYGSKRKNSDGLLGGDGGGLLALLLATHHHRHGGHFDAAPEPLPPPPVNYRYDDRGCNDRCNSCGRPGNSDDNRGNNGPTNINITIILPSSTTEATATTTTEKVINKTEIEIS